ncbi:hypothetical protein ABPG74_000544 [Tetrahymena malaccensis]
MDTNNKEQELKEEFHYFICEQFGCGDWVDKQDEIDASVSKIFESDVQQPETLIKELMLLGLKNEKIPVIKEEYQILMNHKMNKPQKEYLFLWQALEVLEENEQLNEENKQKLFEKIVKLIEQNDKRKIKIFIKQINIQSQAKEELLEILHKKLHPQSDQLEIEANSDSKSLKKKLMNYPNQKTTQNLSNKQQPNFQNDSNQIFGDKFNEKALDPESIQNKSYLKVTNFFQSNQKTEMVHFSEKCEPIKIIQQFYEYSFDQVYVRNKVITQNVNKLLMLIKSGVCNCVGFLGDFRVAYQILTCIVPNLSLVELESDDLDQFDQLVAYTDGSTVFIVYHDTKYFQKENIFENTDRSLYIRNILDTCQTVILCLNEDFVKNWSDFNPFQNKSTTEIKYNNNQFIDDFKVSKIETQFMKQPKESQIAKCSLDCQEVIYTWSEVDSQAIFQEQYENNKMKIEKFIDNLNFEIYQTTRFNQEQGEELKITMQKIQLFFLNNNQQQQKIEEIFNFIKNEIQRYQNMWEINSSLESAEIEQDDINILFKLINPHYNKDSSQIPKDVISQTLQDIYQKYRGFCLDCTKKKISFYCKDCMNLQEILKDVLIQYNNSINFKNIQKIKNTQEIVDEYYNNSRKFVNNLQNCQYEQFITQFEDSQIYFTQQINKFKQRIFIKKSQKDNVHQLLKQKIVEHAIKAILKQNENKRILSQNIQNVFDQQKENILSVLQNQLNQEQKKLIVIRPLINQFDSKKNINIIHNYQNLYDVKLPKEAHSILNYFCFDSEIDYLATLNSDSPKEDQKVTIWKISKNSKGNEKQIFQNVFSMNSSDVCIHINSKSKQWIVFDNINRKQAMGEIKKDYSFSQEKSFSNVYSNKIKEIQHTIGRVDNCFILNGFEDKIFIYEKQFSQYYAVSLDSNLIELYNFQLSAKNNNKIEKVENLKIHKVFNCLKDEIYVFETDESLQITDQNYVIKQKIAIDRLRYKDFKIINNQKTVMIIVINQDCQIESYVLTNDSNNEPILIESDIDQDFTERRKGNPMIDNLVESIKNYGQNFVELGCPKQNQLFCYYEEAQPSFQSFNLSYKITQYLKECFKALQINQQIIFQEKQNFNNIAQLINQVEIFLQKSSMPISVNQLKLLLLTRIPIQISTIKQSNYYPLIDGQLQDQDQFQRSESLLKLEDVKKQINFGWFEEVLKNIKNESLYVISIFGRQSVGKSSLLNRMFGTRFGVSVSRCTDGVWLGYTSLNNTQILVLDCEGLFSVKRSKAEELKLLQQITLISDISILLTGLEVIDKPFQDLLNDLVLSNKNKQAGSIYFQGSLQILVKDIIGQKDINTIKNELFPSLNFKINTNINYLHSYLHLDFNNNLQIIRNLIMGKLNKKQQNAEQTLSIFKYSIAQLFLDDDTDIEQIYYKFEIQNLTKQFKFTFLDINQLKIIKEDQCIIEFFYRNGNKEDNIFIKLNSGIDSFKISHVPLLFDQRKLKLSQDMHQKTNSINRICLKKIFDEQFDILQIIDHNNYYQQLQNFFNDVLENRKNLIMKCYDNNLPKEEKFKAICNQQKNILDQFISEFSEQFQICQKNCKECERRCIKQMNHTSDCDCQTSHICYQLCQKCIINNEDENVTQDSILNQNSHQCQYLYGHQGIHLCSTKTHFCEQTCQFPQCENQCKREFNHSHISEHDCKQKHMCKQNCKLFEKCRKTCQLEDGHMEEDHLCNSDKCFEKCVFCDKQCSFGRHDHSSLIQDPVRNKQLLTLKYIDEQNQAREVIVDAHLCGESHQCQKLCAKKGICNISYQKEEKEWVSNELKRKFKYNFYKPKNQQQKCSILIPKWQQTHQEQIHECQQNHRCDKTCPECLSFCNKDYNHEGNHQTDTHRNKEQCIFLNKTEGNIQINDSNNQRCYEAGESAEPENCFDSCLRQGRAHFHLKVCQGGDLCAENLFPLKARHSKNKFYPYINKQYDEILCKTYWNSIGWETPLYKTQDKEKEIELCNYACSHQIHNKENKKMNFCTKKAWHQGIHNITKSNCDHEVIYNKKIQICFTVDTTDSMGEVFDQMKSSVENIVNSLKVQDFDIQFAIVCYRDHEEQDDSYGDKGLNIFQFEDQEGVLKNIKQLNAEGGGDTPENVICALYYSCIDLIWDKEALKVIIHIGDAPPHGLEYGLKSENPQWTKNGCPCGIKRKDVFDQLQQQNIKYFMVKCSNLLNKTETILKKEFGEFFRNAVDISDFSQINQKITDFVVREVNQSLEYYHVKQP